MKRPLAAFNTPLTKTVSFQQPPQMQRAEGEEEEGERRTRKGEGGGDATEPWIMCEHFKRWETTPHKSRFLDGKTQHRAAWRAFLIGKNNHPLHLFCGPLSFQSQIQTHRVTYTKTCLYRHDIEDIEQAKLMHTHCRVLKGYSLGYVARAHDLLGV